MHIKEKINVIDNLIKLVLYGKWLVDCTYVVLSRTFTVHENGGWINNTAAVHHSPSGDDGRNVENTFCILWDVNISWTSYHLLQWIYV